MVTTAVIGAAPHYLIADGEPADVRRTRGGDAWEARRAGATGTAGSAGAAGRGTVAGSAPSAVLLGMPASRPSA